MQMDNTCIDIRLQMINYMLWRDDHDSARKELFDIYQWIMEDKEEYEDEVVNMTGKYLVEVEEYQRSFDLFEKLHGDSSSETETLYMLAYNSFKMDKIEQCREYLEEFSEAKQEGAIVEK